MMFEYTNHIELQFLLLSYIQMHIHEENLYFKGQNDLFGCSVDIQYKECIHLACFPKNVLFSYATIKRFINISSCYIYLFRISNSKVL